jgi:hypothetical protein
MRLRYRLASFVTEIITAMLCLLIVRYGQIPLWLAIGLLGVALGGYQVMVLIETYGEKKEKEHLKERKID